MERVGCTVGHYRILAELGRGGMGVVYRADDLRLGRQVALKALAPEVARQEERVARFRREARSLAALNHPCIVTLYAVEEIEGEILLAMELVEGQTLDEATPPRGFDLAAFFRLALPMLDGLAAAHERGIVHRDLKPSNILLTPRGRVKILDFGLAKLRADPTATARPLSSEELTATGALAGTPAYMSPEQMGGSPPDERSDIFAMGAILYQMLSGRHPFRNTQNLAEVVSSILRDDPPPLAELKPGLPRQLDRILRSALEKDPERRSQSAKDLRNQLEALEAETSRGAVSTAHPAVRPRRWRWAAALAAALLLAVLSGLWILDRLRHAATPSPRPHLAVTEYRRFAGETGPDDYRAGLIAVLAERLAGLRGVWAVPHGTSPVPDLLVQVDARRLGEALTLHLRVQDVRRQRGWEGTALAGSVREPYDLLDRAGEFLAAQLRTELQLPVRYRPRPPPTRSAAAFDLYLQAREAAAGGGGPPDLDLAAARVGEALEADPRFAPGHALAGEILRQKAAPSRDPEALAAAAAACHRATQIDPQLAVAHLCLARIHHARQRPVEAQSEYLRTIELQPTALEAYQELRQAFLDMGNPATGERAWKRVIDLHPDHWAGYWALGTFYSESEREDAAAAQYQRALEMAPHNSTVQLVLGNAHYFLGRYEEAIRAWERSAHLDPTNGAAINLGSLYLLLRRFPEAVESLEQAVQVPQADYRAFGHLAAAYFWSPHHRENAAAAFERAASRCQERLATQPHDAAAWIWLALNLARLQRREPSLAALERAFELRPSELPHYYYLAAMVHNRLGEPEPALEWLERAVAGGYPLPEVRLNVEFDNLRDEPRFRALLAGG